VGRYLQAAVLIALPFLAMAVGSAVTGVQANWWVAGLLSGVVLATTRTHRWWKQSDPMREENRERWH
jgi:hypothetical protein